MLLALISALLVTAGWAYAETWYGQFDLGAEHAQTLSSLNNLAYLYQAQGRDAEAEPLYRRALAACKRVPGSGLLALGEIDYDHYPTARSTRAPVQTSKSMIGNAPWSCPGSRWPAPTGGSKANKARTARTASSTPLRPST